MSRNFAGRCFTCRGRGHRAADCPNNRVDVAGSVDESVHRKPHAFGGLERATLYNEQHRQRADGFGEDMNSLPALSTPQQLQPQLQGPVLPQGRLGDPVTPVDQVFFGPRSVQNSWQRMKRRRQVDIMSVPVMNLSDPARPAQPPQQRQAGRGALPGARDIQNSRAGVGLLGTHRVEKAGAAREQAQRQQQRPGSGAKGGRPSEREKGEPQHSTGSAARRSPRRGGSLPRDNHLGGFACRTCGETDHMEADCAKPSSWAGDSSYCPYHRRVSGLEEHDDSKCHKSVDKCWEAVVNANGMGLPRHEVDHLVTNFVRFHRGGRPEPRCVNIHSHWAMCVSRYIRRNGLDGIEASLLPVRRSEVLRRRASGRLSWQEFNHRDVGESRRQFRDTHWDSKDPEELIEKLQDYAYESAPKRHQKRSGQDEADKITADESDAQKDTDMSDAFTPLHDDSSSDLGSGWGPEEYAPDWE